MLTKISNILYNFDLIGPSPQLYIFNNNRYKTFFSFIISVTIIFLSSDENYFHKWKSKTHKRYKLLTLIYLDFL